MLNTAAGDRNIKEMKKAYVPKEKERGARKPRPEFGNDCLKRAGIDCLNC